MNNCAFCKIITGEITEAYLYEDDLVVAFHDKYPVSQGHTLVVPKQHVENIYEILDDVLQRIVKVSKMLATKFQKELNSNGVNIMHASGQDAQQSVFHLHFHVVPRYPDDNLDLWFHSIKRN